MKGVIDYVRNQENLHSDGIKALMNKMDHSNRDSNSLRQMVENGFEFIQSNMSKALKDADEMRARERQMFLEFDTIKDQQKDLVISMQSINGDFETFRTEKK